MGRGQQVRRATSPGSAEAPSASTGRGTMDAPGGRDEFPVVRQAGVLDSHTARRNDLGDGGQRVSGATTNEDSF